MANIIRDTNIEVSNFVDSTSRYASSTVVYYGENSIITLKTYKRQERATDPDDTFMIITKGVEFRPDLVSFDAYGTPNFWWKIMEANGMMDIDDFQAGTNIRIPSVFTIFNP